MIKIPTKKVGVAGRFKERYGRKIRQKVKKVESSSRAKHTCPSCLKESLKLVSAGIWHCSACDNKFSGGAYSPSTPSAKLLKNIERR